MSQNLLSAAVVIGVLRVKESRYMSAIRHGSYTSAHDCISELNKLRKSDKM